MRENALKMDNFRSGLEESVRWYLLGPNGMKGLQIASCQLLKHEPLCVDPSRHILLIFRLGML